jgi:hypothetical protein
MKGNTQKTNSNLPSTVHKQGKLPIDDTLMMVDLLICKKGNKQEMHHGIKINGKTHKPTEDSEFNFKSILANKIRLNLKR